MKNMDKEIEIYQKAIDIATLNNQTVDLDTGEVGLQGDWFITINQLHDILIARTKTPNRRRSKSTQAVTDRI